VRRLVGFVGLICAGYIVAVIAATVVTVFFYVLPTVLPDAGRFGSFYAFASDLPGMLGIGFFWTFMFAWPGFIVAIILIERRALHRPLTYSIAGMLNVIPSLALFSGFVGSPFGLGGLVLAAFPGGLSGGYAYWLLAGRIRARQLSAA
jgi:hypothetical protein